MMNKKAFTNNRQSLNIIKNSFKEVLLASIHSRTWTFFAELIVSVLYALIMVQTVKILGEFFSRAEKVYLHAEKETIWDIFIILVLMYILQEILNLLNNTLPNISTTKIRMQIHKNMQDKASKLWEISYEDKSVLDDINKAEIGRSSAVGIVYSFKELIIFYLPYLIYLNIYLYKIHPLLSVGVIGMWITALVTQSVRTKQMILLQNELANDRRKKNNYSECITSIQNLKETRIIGAYNYFFKKLDKSLKRITKKELKRKSILNLYELICKLSTIIEYAIIIGILFYLVMNKSIGLGIFSAVFISIKSIYDMVNEMVDRCMNGMFDAIGMIKSYYSFKNMDERKGVIQNSITYNNILLENICFRYPNQNHNQIDNLNMNIKKGDTIAIVGENGSGKTTLMKLISGIYLPDSGKVLKGNINVSLLDKKVLFEDQSALLQNFQKYKMSIFDNITIGCKEGTKSTSDVKEICKKYELYFGDRELLDNQDIMLSREFGGIDLSGGQWQMIALLRSIIKDSNVVFLDEPTSALDPENEGKLHACFDKIGSNKTSIIITHRLGVTKMADIIIVMDKGQIKEIGSHNQLLELDGLYKKMWEAQKTWYV